MKKTTTIRKLAISTALAVGAVGLVAPSTQAADCSSNLPTITEVTVDGVAIGLSSSVAVGKLYVEGSGTNGSADQGEACKFQLMLKRNYGSFSLGNDSVNRGWRDITGTQDYMLDHAAFAKVLVGYDATGEQAISASSVVVVKLTLPTTGAYAPDYYYQTKTESILEDPAGGNPITLSGNSLVITGKPANDTKIANGWNAALGDDFNPLSSPAKDVAWYQAQNINLLDRPNGQRMYDNQTGSVSGIGGDFAHNSEYGLMFGTDIVFSTNPKGSTDKSETQRYAWFSAKNSPTWSYMYSNSDGTSSTGMLTLGLGNVHTIRAGASATEELNKGGLKFLLPDAWAELGFGVTSASAPELIAGAIKVSRSEAGATTAVAPALTVIPGVGIVVDAGEVTFSLPKYYTQPNQAMKGKKKGSNVQLSIAVPAGMSGKMGVYSVDKKGKSKKVATVKVKKKSSTKKYKVTVKKAKQGYYAKIGSTMIGSLTS